MFSTKNYYIKFKRKLLDATRRRLERMPLTRVLPLIRVWFTSASGLAALRYESDFLDSLLAGYRGQKILYLSPVADKLPNAASLYRAVYRVYADAEHIGSPKGDALSSCVIADFDILPFDDERFDIVVIHHLLEFSPNPQHLLKETARVTSLGGHMAIIAFNPLSLSGIWAMIWGRVRPGSIWFRHSLLVYRLKDWLSFLEFNHLKTHHLGHFWAVDRMRHMRIGRVLVATFSRLNMPFSAIYCLVSRKDHSGMNLVGPDWREVVLKRTLAVPKSSQYMRITAIQSNKKPIKSIK